jgi:hypothetical protein
MNRRNPDNGRNRLAEEPGTDQPGAAADVNDAPGKDEKHRKQKPGELIDWTQKKKRRRRRRKPKRDAVRDPQGRPLTWEIGADGMAQEPPQVPQVGPGGHPENLPFHRQCGVERRAITERWPVKQGERVRIVKKLTKIVTNDNNTPKEQTQAAAVLVKADALNIAQDRIDKGLKDGQHVENQLMVVVSPEAAKALTDGLKKRHEPRRAPIDVQSEER